MDTGVIEFVTRRRLSWNVGQVVALLSKDHGAHVDRIAVLDEARRHLEAERSMLLSENGNRNVVALLPSPDSGEEIPQIEVRQGAFHKCNAGSKRLQRGETKGCAVCGEIKGCTAFKGGSDTCTKCVRTTTLPKRKPNSFTKGTFSKQVESANADRGRLDTEGRWKMSKAEYDRHKAGECIDLYMTIKSVLAKTKHGTVVLCSPNGTVIERVTRDEIMGVGA